MATNVPPPHTHTHFTHICPLTPQPGPAALQTHSVGIWGSSGGSQKQPSGAPGDTNLGLTLGQVHVRAVPPAVTSHWC